MFPLLQVELAEATRLGVDQQLNVFAGTRPSRQKSLRLHAMVGASGERQTRARALADAVGLASASRCRSICAATTTCASCRPMAIASSCRSAATSRRTFPTSIDLATANVLLGGFAYSSDSRRLATLCVPSFDWLHVLRTDRVEIDTAAPFALALGESWEERGLLIPALSAAAILVERVTTPPMPNYVEDSEVPDGLLWKEPNGDGGHSDERSDGA